MDLKIRKAQLKILEIFVSKIRSFALSGGTALELYYLHHRFSADLDFFSPKYDLSEIEELLLPLRSCSKGRVKLESEFNAAGRIRVRFYTVPVKGSQRPLKIDFVEDVLFKEPKIKKISGLRVYSAENIYLQKLVTITGASLEEDEIGRQVIQGRKEARDAFDIYMLSKKILPLHIFLLEVPGQIQRGIVHWYQAFSRQDLKLGLLDLDIYDKKFDAKKMIIYLENEIKKFTKDILK